LRPQSGPSNLIALRLLATGVLDDGFGDSGVYTGPTSDFMNSSPHILRTSAGSCRVNSSTCQVVALTSGGVQDTLFGTAGIATVGVSATPVLTCNSMVAQPDNRLLVAGTADGTTAFARRLLANGTADASFVADAVTTTMQDATALAVSPDGSVSVAGRAGNGVSGAIVMQLQANGMLNTLFGNAGLTMLDVPSEFGTNSIVRDLKVRSDGGVLAAGGEYFSRHPFVVRLLGTAGGNSPGVIGAAEQDVVNATEQSHEAIVKVRRSGGRSGSVSVAYESAAISPDVRNPATLGADFTHVSGRLSWSDGEMGDKEVHVPIADNESPEYFALTLSDVQGGAGLGTRNATIEIAADGDSHGQFSSKRPRRQSPKPGLRRCG
jgi:hypothetical protein